MSNKIEAIVQECLIQAESCQYTSAGFYEWLKDLKNTNRWFDIAPIIMGALSSFALLQAHYPSIAAVLAMLAGLLPAIYEKLNLKAHTEDILSQAGQYKVLESRFRQAGKIVSLDGLDPLKTEFATLMRQIEDLRSRPILLPEKYFLAAQRKIKKGHYAPDEETILKK